MRVLLGVDGSFHSMYAAEELSVRRWPEDVMFRVVCAVSAPVASPDLLGMTELASQGSKVAAKEHAERLVARVADVLRGRGYTVQPYVRNGDPRPVLVNEAEKWNADLLVVGSHGETRLKRLLLGSVAAYVASHAPCSVEIIREKPRSRGAKGSRWR